MLRQTEVSIAPSTATTVAQGHTITFKSHLVHAGWEQRWAGYGAPATWRVGD